MAEHIAGVDMLSQAEVIELKTKVREYEKEIKDYQKNTEHQENEIARLKRIAGKSYGMGAVWFAAIASFLVGIGVTVAFFLLT